MAQPGKHIPLFMNGAWILEFKCYDCQATATFNTCDEAQKNGWYKTTKTRNWRCIICSGLREAIAKAVIAKESPTPNTPCHSPAIAKEVNVEAHLSDSILCHSHLGTMDNVWLRLAGTVDVVRGRKLYDHDWSPPARAGSVFLHVGGNDFLDSRYCIKETLPSDWEQVIEKKLKNITAKFRTIIVWGDSHVWPVRVTKAGPEQYDAYCKKLIDIGERLGFTCHWVRNLRGIPLDVDKKHFSPWARLQIRELLKELGATVDNSDSHGVFLEKNYHALKKAPPVICFCCQNLRKVNGLVHHLQTCAASTKDKNISISFAFSQLVNFEEAINVFEKNYGNLQDFTVADIIECKQWKEELQFLLGGKYGNAQRLPTFVTP